MNGGSDIPLRIFAKRKYSETRRNRLGIIAMWRGMELAHRSSIQERVKKIIKIKMGSLFDGSGGFPLAAYMCGISPVWASEIEPYPIAVTKSRFTEMEHLGNVQDIHGGTIEPVDVITFGSPCQDMSIAGKREGLKHERNGEKETTRSGLFMEAVRIIKEMRKATDGMYPRFAVWENVPGASSSNKGKDFRLVIQELIGIIDPQAVMPPVPKNGWAYADSYRGDGWSLAYRVFDAQYWGVPQRRRRIYLVADFGGDCAGKILFEREGLRRNLAQSGKERESTAGYTKAHSRKAIIEGSKMTQLCININNSDARYEVSNDGICQTLTARMGTGGNNTPLIIDLAAQKIRKVMPCECARLQGFPDWWGTPEYKDKFTECEYRFWLDVRNTRAKINGKAEREYPKESMLKWYNKLHTDSAEYKMWGNGIALPCALYVMDGIFQEYRR